MYEYIRVRISTVCNKIKIAANGKIEIDTERKKKKRTLSSILPFLSTFFRVQILSENDSNRILLAAAAAAACFMFSSGRNFTERR